jgi:putative addiction module killer protein
MPYLADKSVSLVCQIWHNEEEALLAKARVQRSKTYKSWYNGLSDKEKGIVDTRIDAYIVKDELLKSKLLDSNYCLYEFKWDSGLRVYYSFIEDSNGRLMLLLIGGNKNSQPSDISEAKKIVLKAVTKIAAKKTSKKVATTKKVARKKGGKK